MTEFLLWVELAKWPMTFVICYYMLRKEYDKRKEKHQ